MIKIKSDGTNAGTFMSLDGRWFKAVQSVELKVDSGSQINSINFSIIPFENQLFDVDFEKEDSILYIEAKESAANSCIYINGIEMQFVLSLLFKMAVGDKAPMCIIKTYDPNKEVFEERNLFDDIVFKKYEICDCECDEFCDCN